MADQTKPDEAFFQPAYDQLVRRWRERMVDQQVERTVGKARAEALRQAQREVREADLTDRLLTGLVETYEGRGRYEQMARQAALTALESPITFGAAMDFGIAEYFKEQVEGLIQIYAETTFGLAALEGCFAFTAVGLRAPGDRSILDQLLNIDPCRPYDALRGQLNALAVYAVTIQGFGPEDIPRIIDDLKDAAFDAIVTLVEIVAEEDPVVFDYVNRTIGSAWLLGELCGTVAGVILWEVATEGIGRVAKTAGLIKEATKLVKAAA